jgi:ABC-type nitrate/sulfonate/bicarbonate transport system substrate-binding protein
VIAPAVAFIAMVAAGCSSSAASGGGQSGANSGSGLTDVSIAYSAPIAALAPEMIIQAMPNFCDPYGVHVTTDDLASAQLSPSLVANNIQMAIGQSTGNLALSDASNPDSQIAVAGLGPLTYNAYGSPDTKTVEDVREKTVGATSQGSTTDLVNRAVLARSGIVVGKDAKVTFAANGPAMFALATNNSIAFFTAPPPLPMSITSAGVHVLEQVPGLPSITPLVTLAVVANGQFYSTQPKAVLGVLNCVAAANAYARSHSSETIALIAKVVKTDAATAQSGYTFNKTAYQMFPLTPSAMAIVKAALITDGLGGTSLKSLDVSKIVDTQMVTKVKGALTQAPS